MKGPGRAVKRFWLGLLGAICATAVGAGAAGAETPVTIQFDAHGTMSFTGLESPGPCNGAPFDVSFTDTLPLLWRATYRTTIDNDGTIRDEPGFLTGGDLGTQVTNVAPSAAGPNCALAYPYVQPCSRAVPATSPGTVDPKLSDPDRAARRPGPGNGENVDAQGPVHIGDDNPLYGFPAYGCVFAVNDVSMVNASLPDMFTAHFLLPHDVFTDPATGKALDRWSTDVSIPDTSPVDGTACAAGNNGVPYISCSKSIDWSGTVTITRRSGNCDDGSTDPVSKPCPPTVPVTPYSDVTNVRGPSGNDDTTRGALGSGGISVTATASGAGTLTGLATVPAPNRPAPGAHAARKPSKPIVIATARDIVKHAGAVKIKLRLTKAGKTLLRSWHKSTLRIELVLTMTSKRHKRTVKHTISLRGVTARRKK